MGSDSYQTTSADKRIARNSIYMTIRMVIVLLITLFTTRVVLKALGVVDYGVYNVVCGFVTLFSFLSTSLSNGIQRFYNFELGRSGIEGARKVFNSGLLIQLCIAIFILLIVESFGLWYLHHKMVIPDDRMLAASWIFQFSMVSFLFSVIQAPFLAAIMAHERLDFYAIISVVDAILKLLIAYILSFVDGDKLIIYGALYALISVINFMSYSIYAKLNFAEISLNFHLEKGILRNMLEFSGWNLIGTFANIMKEQGVNLILNLFCGPVVNAARGVAAQVNGGLQSFVQNLTVPVRPQVIQSYAKGDIARTMNLTFMISKMSCFVLYALALPVSYEIDFILSLWLGGNVPEHTDHFVIISMLIVFVNNLNAAISGVVHASGQMRKYQVSTSLVSLISLPFAYVVMRLGAKPEIALLIVFAFVALAQIVALFVLKGIVHFSIKQYIYKVIWPLVKVVILTIWIPLLIVATLHPSFVRLVITTIVSLFFLTIIGYYVCLNKNEKLVILSYLHRLIKRY